MTKRLIMLLLVTSAISGCASLAPVPKAQPVGLACTFREIKPSRQDTTLTKHQVLAHNRYYRHLCPVKLR